ncbi:MAG TPA: PEP-CTERM sorting domain-containing protein [Chthoniobacteraceae bacterium]|nr:PEP-CTERM sorting domain-containing protein [Chthoniobacteraceae bacterium]
MTKNITLLTAPSALVRLIAPAALTLTLLASQMAAQASVVVFDLSGLPADARGSAYGPIYLDFAADSPANAVSTTDTPSSSEFRLQNALVPGPGMPPANAYVVEFAGLLGNQVYYQVNAGDTIGASGDGILTTVATIMDTAQPGTSLFSPGDSGYLGVSVWIDEEIHYGWVAFTITDYDTPNVRIDTFAYNTVAGEDIVIEPVPEPSTLGLLALGGLGLFHYSRRRQRGKVCG